MANTEQRTRGIGREMPAVALFIAASLFLFWDMVVLKCGLLKGDYLSQFYPWSMVYAESLKQLKLPLWTRYVQCGFPLFAEGQIGMLYPLNILFFYFLPFKFAYNYSFIFHFILAGLCMYIYARKVSIDMWGALLAAVLLCFGSVYGGAFLNIATLRSLCYFPLILLIFEKYLDSQERNIGYFFLIGIIWGVQLLAGAAQMTAYSIFFCLVYFFCRNYTARGKFFTLLSHVIIAVAVSMVISLPQMHATFELARHSNRIGRTIGFALWNSFSPLAFTGAVYPYFGSIFLKGSLIYISLLGLFFIFVSFSFIKRDRVSQAFLLMFAVAVFFALGKYNPLFVAMLKIVRFYPFRAPYRFVYFACFALSILSAKGFSYVFSKDFKKLPMRIYNGFAAVLVIVTAMFFSAMAILRYFTPQLMRIVKTYVAANIYGKPFHRHSLDSYMSRVEYIFAALKTKLSLVNPFVIYGFIIALATLVIIYVLIRRFRGVSYVKYICLGFIFLDLVIASFYLKGPVPTIFLRDFDEMRVENSSIFRRLKEDSSIYRICPFGPQEELPEWAYFNMNTIYGLDSIGIYTPLMNSDYFMMLENLGVVDDSLGIVPPDMDEISRKQKLLRDLNVKYIISPYLLTYDFLQVLAEDKGIFLYEMEGHMPRFVFSKSTKMDDRYGADIDVEKYTSGFADISIKTDTDGFFVFSEKYYPGWIAYVDGKEAEIIKTADLMQAVKVPSGRHTVQFIYEPFYLRDFLLFSFLGFILCGAVSAVFLIRRLGKEG